MADKQTDTPASFPAELRRVETSFAETGDPAKGSPTGYAERIDVTYELGAVIDGAWVKVASVPGSTVDALVARQAEQDTATEGAAPEASA